MTSFVDDGWGDDEDLDVSASNLGDGGWGDDDDFFDDDVDVGNEYHDLGFPPAAPAIPQSSQLLEFTQPSNDQEDLNVDGGWGEDDDLFDDDSDEKEDEGIGFPPATPAVAESHHIPEVSQPSNDENKSNVDDGWGEDDDFFDDDSCDSKEGVGTDFPPTARAIPQSNAIPDSSRSSNGPQKVESEKARSTIESSGFGYPETAIQGHSIPIQQSQIGPPPNDFYRESNPMVTELSKYIQSLERMLSSINAVLEFEYNTSQKAEELSEYYDKRPQLAEYTRTKELQRMNYEIFLPDGYIETSKKRIVDENLLPDNAIVSRAANQSLLADILQVITGHDLIVRPQYLASCIATSCKFIIHKGDHGADMIDCRAVLSLFLPTESDRLNIAEVTVSVVFSPSQPMIEFRVVKIDVLLKDFSKLSNVAEFLRAMDIPVEDHEIIDAPPDMYRDAFLEKSQRFFSLSSEGMKVAFQQMDSVINLKGKMKSISNFIPDTDQLLAAEQEAAAFAEARRIEIQRQQQNSESAFPRPPPPQNLHRDQMQTETKRPKSILGGLVRSGWKTLASSVAIPDDDPDIYGEFVPTQPLRAQDQAPLKFYRTEEHQQVEGPRLYRKSGTQDIPNSTGGHQLEMNIQRQQNTTTELGSSITSDKVNENESFGHGFQTANLSHELLLDENRFAPESGTSCGGQSESHDLINMNADTNDVQHSENFTPAEPSGPSRELGEEKKNEADEEEVVENEFDDGWDDGLDGFDDISDTLEEVPAPTKIPAEQEVLEKDNVSPDIVLVPSSSEALYDEENDVCETRRRWVNPRPHRPYLKYLLP